VFGGKLKAVDSSPVDHKRGIKQVVRLDDAVVVVADRFWRARDAVAALTPAGQWCQRRRDVAQIAARHAAVSRRRSQAGIFSTGDGVDALKNAARRGDL